MKEEAVVQPVGVRVLANMGTVVVPQGFGELLGSFGERYKCSHREMHQGDIINSCGEQINPGDEFLVTAFELVLDDQAVIDADYIATLLSGMRAIQIGFYGLALVLECGRRNLLPKGKWLASFHGNQGKESKIPMMFLNGKRFPNFDWALRVGGGQWKNVVPLVFTEV